MAVKRKRLFKKIQWKLILVFLLLIVSVMIIAGTFLLSGVMTFYHNQFKRSMNEEFTGAISKNLQVALNREDPESKIKEVMEAFSTSRLGINEFRNYYVLDGKNGSVIFTSDENNPAPDLTPNILTALGGENGDEVSLKENYMDYAYALKQGDDVKYIIYVRDSKNDVREVTKNLAMVVLQAIGFGALIALILGVFLSRSISVPIKNLTEYAGKIADGKFDASIEPQGNDEIGILTNTFNIMSQRLKQTLDEISGEKDKIEVVLENMADGIVAFDSLGNSVHINPAAEKLLSLEKNKSYKFDEFFEMLGLSVKLSEVIESEDFEENDIQFDIDETVVNVHFAPYKTENSRTEGIIVAFQDITKQQKLDDTRKAFVADVSHELRTPITNIKSYSETLLDADIEDAETTKNFLKVINNESDRMARLVNDLLVLSQFDYSKVKFKFSDVNITELVNDTVNAMRIEAKNRNFTFDYIVRNNVPETIVIDRDRISQVVTNIISNAFKYTKDGGIITVILSAVADNVLITVVDNGVGIPEKDLPHIFDRFYRVDKARSRAQGGTGLGLAIAKEIIEAHSGSITIESKYGEGSTVIITLPVSQSNELRGETDYE